MKVWNTLFDIITLFILMVFLLAIIKTAETNERQFEEMHLSYAVDFSTKAAFRISISTNTIGTDYSNGGLEEVIVSPESVLTSFEQLMCFNFGLSDGEENRQHVRECVAGGLLMSHDGYYVLEPYEYDHSKDDSLLFGDYALLWGLKRPYLVQADDGLYSCSLVNEKWTRYPTGTNEVGLYELEVGNEYAGTALTESLVRLSIGTQLTEDLNRSVQLRNLVSAKNNVGSFFLPGEATVAAVNNIKSPSLVILFQDDAYLTGYNELAVVSVGGARVKVRVQVLGFTRANDNGPGEPEIYYYCYAGQQLGYEAAYGLVPTRLFESVHEAAQAGYHPDFVLLSKPIPE